MAILKATMNTEAEMFPVHLHTESISNNLVGWWQEGAQGRREPLQINPMTPIILQIRDSSTLKKINLCSSSTMKTFVSPEDFTAAEEIILTLPKNNVKCSRRCAGGPSLRKHTKLMPHETLPQRAFSSLLGVISSRIPVVDQ